MSCNDCCAEDNPCTECCLRRALERTQADANTIRKTLAGVIEERDREHALRVEAEEVLAKYKKAGK